MNILKPYKLKNIEFMNRIVMSPMVPLSLADGTDGFMSKEVVSHYLKRADTGIGLIVLQASSVNPKHMNYGVGITNHEHADHIKPIIEKCHAGGTKVFIQLTYVDNTLNYVDAINKLGVERLKEVKDNFIHSIRLCKKIGFDGIELHGAHAFFLNKFSSPFSNKRSDEYGGDAKGRLHLVKEIIEGVKDIVDDNFIISYRLGWSDTLKTDIENASELESIGVEMLHVSSGLPKHRTTVLPENFDFNEIIYTGTIIKAAVNIPVIVVNDIKTFSRGEFLIKHGLADFVAYGRPFLTDPDFMKNL